MAHLRFKEIAKMDAHARNEKLIELRLELVKAAVKSGKTSMKTKDIKKAIARLLTFANAAKSGKAEKQ